jgi:hypothetical protein
VTAGDEAVDVEIEHPHQHHSTGHRWLDKILPVSALFVSLISILIAFHHGGVMQDLVRQNERLVQANSLPHLQLFSNSSSENFNLVASNAGIGPADIRSVQLLIRGKPVRNIEELLSTCCGVKRGGVSRSGLLGTMIRPGQDISYVGTLSTTDPRAVQGLSQLYNQRAIETRVCYCSVFDECWVRSSFDHLNSVRPRSVKQCPAWEPQYR